MTEQELSALSYVAANQVLFHQGAWGGPPGYRWRGQDGAEAGLVPPWATDVLDALARRELIRTERHLGPLDVGLTLTPSGTAALGAVAA